MTWTSMYCPYLDLFLFTLLHLMNLIRVEELTKPTIKGCHFQNSDLPAHINNGEVSNSYLFSVIYTSDIKYKIDANNPVLL